MHISCLSLSLPHSLTHFRIIYVRAYIHDEHYCILFPLLHFIQRILPLLKFVIFSSSSSSSSFFVTNGEIFPPLKSLLLLLLFFCGTRKEKFSVSFHCLVCVCHEDDDEKAEKTTSSSSSYSSSREMRFREW